MIIASNATAVSAGGFHSMFLKSDGSLWVTGYNAEGQLGDGLTTDLHTPQPVVSSGVIAISAGYHHSLFLKSDGSLWAMGGNNYGQLGNGTTANSAFPLEIVTNQMTRISAGGSHSLFVKRTGTIGRFTTELFAMGDNYFGQLGDGTTNNESTPEFILSYTENTTGYPVTAISAGGDFSLFLESNGSLWGMGDNSFAELGDGTYTSHNKPEQILSSGVTLAVTGEDSSSSFFVKSDGSLWDMGGCELWRTGQWLRCLHV
jgi:alpha-tubulin suppressor-like RCC1 family protein